MKLGIKGTGIAQEVIIHIYNYCYCYIAGQAEGREGGPGHEGSSGFLFDPRFLTQECRGSGDVFNR